MISNPRQPTAKTNTGMRCSHCCIDRLATAPSREMKFPSCCWRYPGGQVAALRTCGHRSLCLPDLDSGTFPRAAASSVSGWYRSHPGRGVGRCRIAHKAATALSPERQRATSTTGPLDVTSHPSEPEPGPPQSHHLRNFKGRRGRRLWDQGCHGTSRVTSRI